MASRRSIPIRLTGVGARSIWSADTLKVLNSPPNEQARLDYSLRLWDAATGRPIGRPLVGHLHDVQSVSFSRDGKRVVSASVDGTTRIWEVFGGWADALCAKLPRNPTDAEWHGWIGPAIEYVCPCPGLGTHPACGNTSDRK